MSILNYSRPQWFQFVFDVFPDANWRTKTNHACARSHNASFKMDAPTTITTITEPQNRTNKISTKGFLFSLGSSVYFCLGGSWAQSACKSGLFVWAEASKKMKAVTNLATDSHYPDPNSGGKLLYFFYTIAIANTRLCRIGCRDEILVFIC